MIDDTSPASTTKAAAEDPIASWAAEAEEELKTIGSNLFKSSIQIQQAFEKYSVQSTDIREKDGMNLPDPIELVNRISKLESTIATLQIHCQELEEERPKLAKEVTELLCSNYNALHELCILVNGEHASMDATTEQIACKTYEHHLYWAQVEQDEKKQQQAHRHRHDGGNDYNDIETAALREMDPTEDTSTIHKEQNPTQKTQSNTTHFDKEGNIIISPQIFQSLSLSTRGTCKLQHVQQVATLIHKEYTSLYRDAGYRGKDLQMERSDLLKYTKSVKGLYSVIMNTSIWRYITGSLEELGFIRLNDADGSFFWLHHTS